MNPLQELEFRGKTLEEGKELAAKQGFQEVRVSDLSSPEGIAFTLEYMPKRITFSLQNGKIIQAVAG